ncbi:MAG: AtpZ/AtpI family protein [Chloroflexota bacterium]
MGGEVGGVTLLIVFLAVFGGLWLDQVLGTKPILTVILVLASAPLALALTFWLAMRAVKDIQPPSQSGKHPGVSQGNTQDEKEGGDDW